MAWKVKVADLQVALQGAKVVAVVILVEVVVSALARVELMVASRNWTHSNVSSHGRRPADQ